MSFGVSSVLSFEPKLQKQIGVKHKAVVLGCCSTHCVFYKHTLGVRGGGQPLLLQNVLDEPVKMISCNTF